MSRDANKKRLALLKQNLVDELKSDSPGLLYIEDLKLSINRIEQIEAARCNGRAIGEKRQDNY